MLRGYCVGVVILAFAVPGITGCATILHGSSQRVTVTSIPSGTRFTVDGEGSHTTPATLKLERKRDHTLVFEHAGYHPEQVTLTHVISGAVAGNILLGGLIGWGIDAVSGAQYRLVPETVHVELDPLQPGQTTVGIQAATPTPQDRLRNLKELLDEGLITQEEYDAMRKKTLDGIAKGQ